MHDNSLVNPVVIDCTSSEYTAQQYPDMMLAGLHVVTPNKKANTASTEFYELLRATAQKTNRQFLYETTVGAGLPVIDNLQNLFYAGDELVRFEGILSGSLSFVFGKLDEGLTLSQATEIAKKNGDDEAFVIGGGQIYKTAFDNELLDKLYITYVHHSFDADVFFPSFASENWKKTSEIFHPTDEIHEFSFSYVTYERKK